MMRDPNYVLPLPARKPINLVDRTIARPDPSRPRIIGPLSIGVDNAGRPDRG
jgi:hypothetical protein